MSASKTLAVIALSLGLPTVGWGQDSSPSSADVPIRLTRQADFGIPFELSKNARTVPAEVHLYVASQGGKDWKLYQRQRPTAKGFQFQAAQDGEYWFAVRTVDRQGKLISHQSWQPEMKVIVDTQSPRLQLELKLSPGGQATAKWQAVDPNLAAHTFQLHYQTTASDWKPISVDRPAADDWRQDWQGQAQWQLDDDQRVLIVRTTILDRAGNAAEAKEQVSRPSLSLHQGSLAEENEGARLADRFSSNSDSRDAAPQTWNHRGDEPSQELPSFLPSVQPSNRFGATPARELWTRQTPIRDASRGFAPISSSIAPPVANQFEQTDQRLSKPSHTRSLASPHFELDYDLFDIGPKGARRVELWITRDGGDHWVLHGEDEDRESPMEVRVKDEGLYGLRILVHAFDSPPPTPPRRGEAADMVVAIDWNRPFARIRRATYGSVDRRSITIEWQAEDALLEDLPIRLSFGPSAEGPWTPFGTNLPNSGVFHWRPTQVLPQPVYVQLEVSDRAGNVTADVYGSPVSQGEPRVLIRDIRPLTTTSRPRFQR